MTSDSKTLDDILREVKFKGHRGYHTKTDGTAVWVVDGYDRACSLRSPTVLGAWQSFLEIKGAST